MKHSLITRLCRWHGPDLVIVGPHEDIGYARASISHDPFIEILWLCV